MKSNQNQALIFQSQLENYAGKKLQLKINDNRSTMLSVKWDPDCTRVSLHRMFLQAPHNIMEALACYLKGKGRKKQLAPSVKAYIEENLQNLDYSHEIDPSKLDTKGTVYDLEKIYWKVNGEYFEKSLDLKITWYGKSKKKASNKITFGLYQDPLRLIKINRMLDDGYIPEYFVQYVVYHEMLHYLYPSYIDEKGNKQIHGKEFKLKEKEFKYFSEAQEWIRNNQNYLFRH